MTSATARSAQQLLDAVQSLGQLDAFDGDGYVGRLTDELGDGTLSLAGLEARDEALRAALAAIDAFAGKDMRIRLDHLLAGDTSVAPPLRKVLASTITSYVGRLELMGERVEGAAARVDPGRAADTAAAVVDVAERVLSTRAELRAGVLGLARQLASAALPAARAASRDRSSEDAMRQRWVAIRRDLELVVEEPQRVGAARLTERVKTLTEPDEPLEELPEPTRGELIELD
jgi:hypothetical protein